MTDSASTLRDGPVVIARSGVPTIRPIDVLAFSSVYADRARRGLGSLALPSWAGVGRPWAVRGGLRRRRGALRRIASVLMFTTTLIAANLVVFVVQESSGSPVHHGTGLHTSVTTTPSETVARSYGDLISQVVRQDQIGVDQAATDINVVAITDAAGDVRAWRVQLPSTQYWTPLNTTGVNDLSADAVLALFPGVRTQYERAVLDAMHRAGVDDSPAPIMLAGWSLGGMMAAKLATDPQYADRVEAVVAAGSPIDMYADRIGAHVAVTQVDNVLDPVHDLEVTAADAGSHPNWQTHWFTDTRVHNGTMYAERAERLLPAPRAQDAVFFAGSLAHTREIVYTERYSRQ